MRGGLYRQEIISWLCINIQFDGCAASFCWLTCVDAVRINSRRQCRNKRDERISGRGRFPWGRLARRSLDVIDRSISVGKQITSTSSARTAEW